MENIIEEQENRARVDVIWLGVQYNFMFWGRGEQASYEQWNIICELNGLKDEKDRRVWFYLKKA